MYLCIITKVNITNDISYSKVVFFCIFNNKKCDNHKFKPEAIIYEGDDCGFDAHSAE